MIDSDIFGQNQALEKPTRGKPVREREILLFSAKYQDRNTEKFFNLSPPKISSQNLEKRAQQSLENCVEK